LPQLVGEHLREANGLIRSVLEAAVPEAVVGVTFTREDAPEASAVLGRDGHTLVMISRGMIRQLYEVFTALCNDPACLPFDIRRRLADADRVLYEQRLHLNPLWSAWNRRRPPLGPRPRDVLAFGLARTLVQFAIDYLCLHELGHALRGHGRLLMAPEAAAALPAGRRPIEPANRLFRHALELDADRFARAAIRFAWFDWLADGTLPNGMVKPRRLGLPFADPEELFQGWAYALGALFLAQAAARSAGAGAAGTHPSPFHRLDLLVEQTGVVLHGLAGGARDAIAEADRVMRLFDDLVERTVRARLPMPVPGLEDVEVPGAELAELDAWADEIDARCPDVFERMWRSLEARKARAKGVSDSGGQG
ncbi:MAG TPA: hypothetical protein VEA69_08060, partial [Tepidisphaeraceae bacterium]|nr:hypothetical protein [Tepidisphaeraceae bacterium]